MAIVVEEQIEVGAESGTQLTLPSWTPGSNELILVGVSQRNDVTVTSVSGNSITHTQVDSVVCDQNLAQQDVLRGMSGSPTTGSIVVDRASDDGAWLAMAIRISGVDTGGTNGSGAVEASASATNPPATDNDDMKVDVTTVTDSALALAFGCARLADFIVPAGETAIRLNFAAGSGGSNITASIWRETALVSPPATVTLGADDDLSTAREWSVIAMSIKPAAAGGTVDLDAALTSSVTLSATAIRIRAIVAALTGSATISADTEVIVGLLCALAGTGDISGNLIQTRALAAALTSSATTNADITAIVDLLCALTNTATIAGAIDTIVGLDAGLVASATLLVDIESFVGLSAALTGDATLQADVKRILTLSAQLVGSGTVGAQLSVIRDLLGALTGGGTLSGDLQLITELAASLTADAVIAADMRITVNLAADLVGSGQVNAALSVLASLRQRIAHVIILEEQSHDVITGRQRTIKLERRRHDT